MWHTSTAKPRPRHEMVQSIYYILTTLRHQNPLLIFLSCFYSPDDVLRLLARRVDDSKDFKICVSRTDFYQRAMVQWQRQKRGTLDNTLRVTFFGEAGVDTGAIRKEFLSGKSGSQSSY